jgi:hypothetical protein
MFVAFVLAGWVNPGSGIERVQSSLNLLIPLAGLGVLSGALLSFAIASRVLWWAPILGVLPALARAWNILQS